MGGGKIRWQGLMASLRPRKEKDLRRQTRGAEASSLEWEEPTVSLREEERHP